MLSKVAGTSPWHFQRSFTKLYGVSPRQYAAARRVERLKTSLKSGSKSADAVYEAGYGSPSRAYEAAAGALGMTPRAYRSGGKSAEIRYALGSSSLGRVLVASTPRGLCRVAIAETDDELRTILGDEFPAAQVVRDDKGLERTTKAVVALANGRAAREIPTDVRGTVFQQQVWKALCRIPRHPDLRRCRSGNRAADGHARGGPRLRNQPDRAGRPLPPRRAGLGRRRRLPLGHRA
jgi:AraC family transcriptional regulator of adaptative response/methylated-DNA-[protein]-cysteine methyltransferase